MSTVTIQIDTQRSLVIVTPSKSITVDEACSAIKEMIQRPDFRPSMPSIWDLRYTELMHINGQDIGTLSKVAEELKEQRGAARMAVIVGSSLSYGLGRMFELLNETTHLEARVFRSMEQGEQWALNKEIDPTNDPD